MVRLLVALALLAVAGPAGGHANGKLAFVRAASFDTQKNGVYVANPNGTATVQAARDPSAIRPQWSPDGSRLLWSVVTVKPGSTTHAYTVAAASGAGASLALWATTPAVDVSTSPGWLPDGRIGFAETDYVQTGPATWSGGTPCVDALALSGARTTLFCGAAFDAFRWAEPRWSPDGTRIAFMSAGDPAHPHQFFDELMTMAADGTDVRQVTATQLSGPPQWSPDGTKLLAGARYGSKGFSVVAADGSSERVLSTTGRDPAWSPDGKLIVYAQGRALWIMRADGTHAVQATSPPKGFSDSEPSWQPAAKAAPLPKAKP